MSKTNYYGDIDGNLNQLLNRELHKTNTDLGSAEARFFFNTAEDRLKIHNGTQYESVAWLSDLLGLSNWKSPIRVATVGNITLANLQTVDDVSLLAGNKVLVKNQTDLKENGFYTVVAGGAWTRIPEADLGAEILNSMCIVEEGTVNKGTIWKNTDTVITVGVNDIHFAQLILTVPTNDRRVRVSALDTVEKTLSEAIQNSIITSGPGVTNQANIKQIILNGGANEKLSFGFDLSIYTGDTEFVGNHTQTGDMDVTGQTTVDNIAINGDQTYGTGATIDYTNSISTGTQDFDSNYEATYADGSIINQNGDVNYGATSTQTYIAGATVTGALTQTDLTIDNTNVDTINDSDSSITNDGNTITNNNTVTNNNGDTVNNNGSNIENVGVTQNYDSTSDINNNGNTITNNGITTENTGVTTNNFDATYQETNNYDPASSVTNNGGTVNNVGVTENYDNTSEINNNGNTINYVGVTENYDNTSIVNLPSGTTIDGQPVAGGGYKTISTTLSAGTTTVINDSGILAGSPFNVYLDASNAPAGNITGVATAGVITLTSTATETGGQPVKVLLFGDGTMLNGMVSDVAYGASWNGDATNAPSKNAVYDKIETLSSLISVTGGLQGIASGASDTYYRTDYRGNNQGGRGVASTGVWYYNGNIFALVGTNLKKYSPGGVELATLSLPGSHGTLTGSNTKGFVVVKNTGQIVNMNTMTLHGTATGTFLDISPSGETYATITNNQYASVYGTFTVTLRNANTLTPLYTYTRTDLNGDSTNNRLSLKGALSNDTTLFMTYFVRNFVQTRLGRIVFSSTSTMTNEVVLGSDLFLCYGLEYSSYSSLVYISNKLPNHNSWLRSYDSLTPYIGDSTTISYIDAGFHYILRCFDGDIITRHSAASPNYSLLLNVGGLPRTSITSGTLQMTPTY